MAESRNYSQKNNERDSERDDSSLEARKHEAYSQMGKLGGPKGGQARAEQMAREGFHPKNENQNQRG